jgi:hypothetical protein
MTSFLSARVVYIVLNIDSPGKSGLVVGAGVGVGGGVVGAGDSEDEYEPEASAKTPPAMFVEGPAE